MAWPSPPTSIHRSASPKVGFPYHTRASRGSRRRLHLLPWGICMLVLITIVFWPQKRTSFVSKPSQKHPIAQPRPTARPRVDPDDAPILGKKQKKQRTPKQAAAHIYRTDGLLDVNPQGKHPILELMETSEIQWKRKLEHQSKTLKQAVNEYKRRYKRSPPKGFDVW